MISVQLSRLGKNVLIYGIGGGLNRLLNFLLLPLFTSYLTPTEYGISSILSVVVFLITPLFSLGLGAAIGIPYFDGQEADQKPATIWTSFTLLALSVSVMLFGGFGLAARISQVIFQSEDFADLVTISLVTAGLSILCMPFTYRLQFDERVHAFVALTFISSVVMTGVAIWMVVLMKRGILGLLQANLIGQFVTLGLFMAATVPVMPLRFSRRIAGELIRLGVPLIPSFAFLFVIQHGNKYILQWLYGLDVVGIYGIGFNIGMFMSLPVTAFQNAWYPYFMSFVGRQEEAPVIFSRVLTYYMLGFGGMSLLFFIFARPLVMVMTQPAFHQAYQVVGLAAAAQCLIGVSSILLPGMYFARKVEYVSFIQFIAAVASVILNIVLIRLFGILGGAIALPLALIIMNLTQLIWNTRQGYLRVPYETGRLVKFTIVYLLIALPAVLLNKPPLVLQILWSSLLFVSACFGLAGLLTQTERSFVLRWAKKWFFELRRNRFTPL
jgi:O-antigen/teichoic acid export membrane protein